MKINLQRHPEIIAKDRERMEEIRLKDDENLPERFAKDELTYHEQSKKRPTKLPKIVIITLLF